jgi:hypothetical protein
MASFLKYQGAHVVLDSDCIIELAGKYGLPLLVFALACYYTDRNLLRRVQDVKGATLHAVPKDDPGEHSPLFMSCSGRSW